MKIEIACPKCEWEPDGGSYWECSCGHLWNTFKTSGKCPKCSTTWADTQCPGPTYPGGCGSWSKHIDWYRNLDNEMRKEIEEILQEEPVAL